MRTRHPFLVALLVVLLSLAACTQQESSAPTATTAPEGHTTHTGSTTEGGADTDAVQAPAPAAIQPDAVTLNPSAGEEIGYVYEAYLSPFQEPGEEEETPALIPDEFRSTTASVSRGERGSRGHGMIRFTKDLSRAYVDVQVEGIKIEEVVMFHIHCGVPDQLGPIIADFALLGDIKENMADGLFSVVVTNDLIERTAAQGEGVFGTFTMGCPVEAGGLGDVRTVAAMERFAQKGELYFNLHTSGQVFYGNMRGQVHPVTE